MSSNSGGGIRFSNVGNSLNNARVVRTDKYDNDPYRDKVVLHLPLHENFNDVSGYNRVHSVTGTPLIDSDNYVRKGGSCDINLGGINFATANWMNLNQDFTIECWYSPYGNGTHPSGVNRIMSKWKSGSNLLDGSFQLNASTNSIGFISSTNGVSESFTFYTPFDFEFHKWYHIVLQRKNNVFSAYINGVKYGEQSISVSIRTGSQPLLIGRLVYTGEYDDRSRFNISDLRITLGVARYDGTFIPQ